jgi:hypothetical protein
MQYAHVIANRIRPAEHRRRAKKIGNWRVILGAGTLTSKAAKSASLR